MKSPTPQHRYSHSWTQPYTLWAPQPQYPQAAEILDQLLLYRAIDQSTQNQLTFPQAASIIAHIANKHKD